MDLRPEDLDFLQMGLDGPFDEQRLACSAVAHMGTGRILDILGSMLERDIIHSHDGGYAISGKVRAYLWDQATPLRTRLLRLLRVAPLEIPQIRDYLGTDDITGELRSLEEAGLVQSYPVLREGVPVPLFQAASSYDAVSELSDIIRQLRPNADAAILERLEVLLRHLNAAPGPGS